MGALNPAGAALERKALTKKIVAIVGAENAPGLGLVRAIVEDLKGEFAARAIVRSLDSAESRLFRTMGAEVVVGDPRDAASLKRGFAGAYGAFYVQLSSEHPSLETKLATATAVAGAAKDAGIRHVVWATLEDPGQTFLEHNDVTPTFQNGRWISDGQTERSPEQIFGELAIPTTFLHTAWEAAVAAGKWTEDIGRHAYGLLRDRESIGQTVSISASRLIRRPTPAPGQNPAIDPTVGSAAVATVAAPPIPPPALPASPPPPLASPASPQVSRAPSTGRTRTIAIVGAVAAVALVGLVVTRQMQSRKAVPAPDPIETPRAVEAVRPPPIATKAPEPPLAPTPAVVAAPEPPPSPAEVAPPEAEDVTSNDEAGSRHVRPTAKNHRRPPTKVGPVALAAPAAPAPHPSIVPAKAEAPPKIEAPPERAAPAPEPAPPAVAALRAPAPVRAPAPTPAAPALAPAPPKSDLPQPGFVDPKTVNAIVRAHAAEANACYERATMEHPDLHGRLTIHAVIDPTGHVVSISPVNAIVEGARLQNCLVGAFKSWAFPRPAGGVNGNVTYSFAFEAP